MTLLVGIRCSDGVVVAADSASTFTDGRGGPTISHPTNKVDIIADSMIVAGTGAVGLGQRFHAIASQIQAQAPPKAMHTEIAKAMSATAQKDFASTFAKTGTYGALAAFNTDGVDHLCEFAISDFQPEMKEEKCWYVSMGSGQAIADPYLALVRLTFWQDGPPTLEGGKFAAAWVMRHAIRVAPGMIAEPISIATLSNGHAQLIEPSELDEHINMADESLRHLGSFADRLQASDPPDLPEP